MTCRRSKRFVVTVGFSWSYLKKIVDCQEPNMTKSRLAVLIDSLAAGVEVFTSQSNSANDINEMEVVLGEE